MTEREALDWCQDQRIDADLIEEHFAAMVEGRDTVSRAVSRRLEAAPLLHKPLRYRGSC